MWFKPNLFDHNVRTTFLLQIFFHMCTIAGSQNWNFWTIILKSDTNYKMNRTRALLFASLILVVPTFCINVKANSAQTKEQNLVICGQKLHINRRMNVEIRMLGNNSKCWCYSFTDVINTSSKREILKIKQYLQKTWIKICLIYVCSVLIDFSEQCYM